MIQARNLRYSSTNYLILGLLCFFPYVRPTGEHAPFQQEQKRQQDIIHTAQNTDQDLPYWYITAVHALYLPQQPPHPSLVRTAPATRELHSEEWHRQQEEPRGVAPAYSTTSSWG